MRGTELGLPEEQYMLLTAGSSLQPHVRLHNLHRLIRLHSPCSVGPIANASFNTAAALDFPSIS